MFDDARTFDIGTAEREYISTYRIVTILHATCQNVIH